MASGALNLYELDAWGCRVRSQTQGREAHTVLFFTVSLVRSWTKQLLGGAVVLRRSGAPVLHCSDLGSPRGSFRRVGSARVCRLPPPAPCRYPRPTRLADCQPTGPTRPPARRKRSEEQHGAFCTDDALRARGDDGLDGRAADAYEHHHLGRPAVHQQPNHDHAIASALHGFQGPSTWLVMCQSQQLYYS